MDDPGPRTAARREHAIGVAMCGEPLRHQVDGLVRVAEVERLACTGRFVRRQAGGERVILSRLAVANARAENHWSMQRRHRTTRGGCPVSLAPRSMWSCAAPAYAEAPAPRAVRTPGEDRPSLAAIRAVAAGAFASERAARTPAQTRFSHRRKPFFEGGPKVQYFSLGDASGRRDQRGLRTRS